MRCESHLNSKVPCQWKQQGDCGLILFLYANARSVQHLFLAGGNVARARQRQAVDLSLDVDGWEDGLACRGRSLFSDTLLSHSRPTWACGANWLLIAGLYTRLSPHAETSSFKGNQPNEIIYQSMGLSRQPQYTTPTHSLQRTPPGKSYLQKVCMLSLHHYGFTPTA